jgi:hypothetical protein
VEEEIETAEAQDRMDNSPMCCADFNEQRKNAYNVD